MKFFPKVISVLTIMSMLPTPALAATNQETVSAALRRMETEGSIMHMNARVHVSDLDLAGRETSSGDVEFQVKTKTRPTNDPAIKDSDGRFTLTKFTIASGETGFPGTLALDAPLVIEWVNRHPMKYVRLQQVPNSVAGFFGSIGINILGIQKTWIGFEWDLDTLTDEFLGNENFSGLSTLGFTSADLADGEPLAVSGIERTYRNARGETITRYRAKLSKEYVNELYAKRIAEAGSDFSRELLQSEREEQLRLADSVGFAINYNNATNRIERIEMGGKVTEPKNGECEIVNNQLNCKQIGTTVTTYSVGMTFFPDDQRPIYHPPGWRWFNDIADRLEFPPEALPEAFTELMSRF